MGCAIAYHLLMAEPALDVIVVEPDPTYAKASTSLSDGNVRIQFNLEENVAMSQYAMDIHNRIEEFRDEVNKSIRQKKNFTDQRNNFTNQSPGQNGSTQHWARHDNTTANAGAIHLTMGHPSSHPDAGRSQVPLDGSRQPKLIEHHLNRHFSIHTPGEASEPVYDLPTYHDLGRGSKGIDLTKGKE